MTPNRGACGATTLNGHTIHDGDISGGLKQNTCCCGDREQADFDAAEREAVRAAIGYLEASFRC